MILRCKLCACIVSFFCAVDVAHCVPYDVDKHLWLVVLHEYCSAFRLVTGLISYSF